MQYTLFTPCQVSQKELADLTSLLYMLTTQYVQLWSQFHRTISSRAKAIIRKLLRGLKKEIRRIQNKLDDVIKRNTLLIGNLS